MDRLIHLLIDHFILFILKQRSSQLKEIREDAKALCGELNAEYWEVSAKSGIILTDYFTKMGDLLILLYQGYSRLKPSSPFSRAKCPVIWP